MVIGRLREVIVVTGYVPDEQDEIVGDAMAVGGPAFVEELHYAAMEAAEAVVPWDGNGREPDAYRAIWVAFARKMVAERRHALSASRTPEPAPEPDPADAGSAASDPALPGRGDR